MAESTFEASPSTNGGNRKLFLIIGAVLGLGLVAVVVFVVVLAINMGWFGGGTDMIVGFPSSDQNYDIYLLEMGQPADEGIPLAKDVQIGEYSIYVFQDQEYSRVLSGAGFVPDSSYVFLAYQDNGDAVYEQMSVRADQPDELFISNESPVLIAFPEKKNVVIVEYADGEAGCYLAPFGEEADRVAKGIDCIFLPDGETLVVVEEVNGEYAFKILDLSNGEENTFLELDEMPNMYQVSFDGSMFAYVEDKDEEQELHIVNLDDDDDDKVAKETRILDFGFAPRSGDFYYIVEDDEGNLSLYLNEENDPVAEGKMVAAQFGPRGEYLIFSAGDELDDMVVSSYSLKNNEAEEIVDGEGLEFAVLSDPAQVIIIETSDDGDLIVYSSSVDGGDVVEVLDERDVFSWDIWSVSGHDFLYFVLYTEDDTFAYAYPFGGDGFFFAEEWANVYLLNVSPNGKYLAFAGSEDAGDDPVLYYLELEEGSKPVELDGDAEWFSNGVFTKNSRELVYTAETGPEADEVSVNQVALEDSSPETLYDEAYLIDVEWGELAPFDYLNFAYTSAGETYCPGAISLSPDVPIDLSLNEGETMCLRFSAGAGEVWNLDFDSVSTDLDLEATLLDSNGLVLSYNDDGLYNLDPWLAYHFEQSGGYFVEVADLEGAAGDFTITLLESEDSFATAEPYFLGETLQGTITERSLIYMVSPEFDDEPMGGIVGKVFRLELDENIPVSLNATIDGGNEIAMALLDEDAVLVEEDLSESGVGEARLEVTPSSSGTYYLLLVITNEEVEPEILTANYELGSEGSGGFSEGFLGEIEYDETVTGFLINGVRDEWRFSGEEGDKIQITLESSGFDSYLELVDPDGVIVAEDDDSAGDRNAEISYELEASGDFTIIARAYGDTGEGEYTLSLEATVSEEPDSTPQPTKEPIIGGGELEIDDFVFGFLENGARDVWTFEADDGILVSIELISEDFDCVLELLDEDGVRLAFDDDSAGEGDSLIENFEIEADGTYTIIVGAYNDSGSGDYVLSLSGEESKEVTIEYGESVDGNLIANGEELWVFYGESSDMISIEMYSNDFDTVLTLLDEDGFEVAYDDDGGGDSNSMIWNFVLPETGFYTIVAGAFDDDGSGDYTVYIEETVIVITGTIFYDDEINSDIVEGERQVWAFDGSAGDVVTISLESSDFDTFLELRNDSGTVLIDDDDSGQDRNSLIEDFELDETGTFWIVARSFRGDQSGDFTLTLTEGE